MRTLNQHDIHIWHIDKQVCLPTLNSVRESLSPDEITRAKRFHFERDQINFQLFHGYLRHILCHYVDIHPKQLQFDHLAHGKPILANRPIPLEFNMSHTKEHAVIAITHTTPIGIDIEATNISHDEIGLTKRFFSKEEYNHLISQPPDKQSLTFYRLWTCKEAFVKATGLGLQYGLSKFTVIPTDEQSSILTCADEMDTNINQWVFQTFNRVSNNLISIALQRLNNKIHWMDIQTAI